MGEHQTVAGFHELNDRFHRPSRIRELLVYVPELAVIDDCIPTEGDDREFVVPSRILPRLHRSLFSRSIISASPSAGGTQST